ncbi:MAG: hypothetical protein LQ352_007485 [Teloschistes flavicans]|nr:MAG: hypothetical protein LQ352_007485 [Teloschistes flavicans]
MGKLVFLAATTTALALANAFCVDFNSADHCTGAVIGKFLGTTGSACQTSFTQSNSSQSIPASAGTSFNVVIQPQDSDKRTGVAFYGRENCEVLIGFGNVPVCTGVGAWSSFKVITIDEADDQLTNLDPAPILSISPNATATASAGDHLPVPSGQSAAASNSGAASGTGSSSTTTTVIDTGIATGTGAAVPTRLGPIGTTSTASTTSEPISTGTSTATPLRKRGADSPELSKRIAHGSVQEHHGQLFKYHQVATRAWRGVPLDQWNEKIHKRVTRDHITTYAGRLHAREIGPVGGTGPDPHRRGITPRSLSELERRAIPPSKCNLVRTCMIDSGDNDGFGISNAGNALLSAIKALNPAGDSWQFIEHPLVVEVTDGSSQVQGYIYAQTRQEHSNVATCSDTGSEMDALTSAIEMGVSGSTVSDMRIDLKLLTGNGVTNTLFVSTRKIGNADMRIHPICEAIQLFD